MKRIAISLLVTLMLMGSGLGVYARSNASDTPACCQKQESCCPSSSCCPGGKHGQCPMMRHHA